MGYIMAEDAYSSRKWYAGLNESANAMRPFLPLQHRQKILLDPVGHTSRHDNLPHAQIQWVSVMLPAYLHVQSQPDQSHTAMPQASQVLRSLGCSAMCQMSSGASLLTARS